MEEIYNQRIPKKIWMIAKDPYLPEIQDNKNQWSNMNPGYEIKILNDADIERFIFEKFEDRVYDAFKKLDVGVMKADFARYCIVYAEGGIYTDVDTQCLLPIDNWGIDKYKIIVAREKGAYGFLCNWTFAAIPCHPLLRIAIELMCERINKGINTKAYSNYGNNGYIVYYTGPVMFNNALDIFLKMYQKHDLDFIDYNNDDIFQGKYVRHFYWSIGNIPNYEKWRYT